jgi:hypothetical protein
VNAGTILNAVAVTVSALALAVTVFLGSRQLIAMRRSNSTLVAIDLLTQECRTKQFLVSEEYVNFELRHEFPAERGVAGLSPEAREHVTRIGLYYASLGMMSVLDVVDHALLISCVHYRVRQSWQVLEPYIEVERKLRKSTYMAYFEHLACVAAEADPAQLHRDLGLRKIGAHSREFAVEFAVMERARTGSVRRPLRRRRSP